LVDPKGQNRLDVLDEQNGSDAFDEHGFRFLRVIYLQKRDRREQDESEREGWAHDDLSLRFAVVLIRLVEGYEVERRMSRRIFYGYRYPFPWGFDFHRSGAAARLRDSGGAPDRKRTRPNSS